MDFESEKKILCDKVYIDSNSTSLDTVLVGFVCGKETTVYLLTIKDAKILIKRLSDKIETLENVDSFEKTGQIKHTYNKQGN